MVEIKINLPDEYVDKISDFIENIDPTYENIEEFIRESIRMHYRKMSN